MKTDSSLAMAITRAKQEMIKYAIEVHPHTWQGIDVTARPEMTSYEILNFNFQAPLGREDLIYYQRQVEPNLPWADMHFLERVSGVPLNPGKEWANWPWASSADKFREHRTFNHTYMERLWPKYARGEVIETTSEWCGPIHEPNKGIRQQYGDLDDLIQLLAYDPTTRQAWIPLFFPEDTGISDGGRKPCTLGYQVIVRENKAHIYYPLRSCDFIRHFRDDIYLAIRLLLWVIAKCRHLNPVWENIRPGTLTMHMTSLHVFKNDWPLK
jgi:hypothetical protein